MSQKFKLGRPPAVSDDAVLEAARDSVLAVGVRRTSLAEVARRLGVSRPTIYRRWPDIVSLTAAVHTREWLSLVAAHLADVGPHPSRKELVSVFVEIAAAIRKHPLFVKFRDVDPELLVPYIVRRRGSSTDAMLATIESLLATAQADGQVRDGDPAVLARAVLLTGQSFVLSSATMTDRCSVEQLDAELRTLLDRYLAPDART